MRLWIWNRILDMWQGHILMFPESQENNIAFDIGNDKGSLILSFLFHHNSILGVCLEPLNLLWLFLVFIFAATNIGSSSAQKQADI